MDMTTAIYISLLLLIGIVILFMVYMAVDIAREEIRHRRYKRNRKQFYEQTPRKR